MQPVEKRLDRDSLAFRDDEDAPVRVILNNPDESKALRFEKRILAEEHSLDSSVDARLQPSLHAFTLPDHCGRENPDRSYLDGPEPVRSPPGGKDDRQNTHHEAIEPRAGPSPEGPGGGRRRLRRADGQAL
jgi:hypothetical protein